jgi:hypothetical protein
MLKQPVAGVHLAFFGGTRCLENTLENSIDGTATRTTLVCYRNSRRAKVDPTSTWTEHGAILDLVRRQMQQPGERATGTSSW